MIVTKRLAKDVRVFTGSTEFPPCPVKDCTAPATERHHILYERHEGGPVKRHLCAGHHSWITRAQSHAARKQHMELTEKQRWFFWFKLVKGEMKSPRNTALDREWRESKEVKSMFSISRGDLKNIRERLRQT